MADRTAEPVAATGRRAPDSPAPAARFARSALTGRGAHVSTGEVGAWLERCRRAGRLRVDRIPFAAMDGWRFADGTGNLVHDSGRFFGIEGLHVTADGGARDWYQPIICQPEVGILGLLAKEFDGVLHFLMQAKMEPGNVGLLELSPTVQATPSNYGRVHGGSAVRYLEYFTGAGQGRVLVDLPQSEHGSWFHRKYNRNMIVEAVGEVPRHDDFCWLTLGQINTLLHDSTTINMDSRTILSCIPVDGCAPVARHSDTQLLSWLDEQRARCDLRAERVPLAAIPGWERRGWSIDHVLGRYFRVVAVSVRADSREATRWTQPLIEPRGGGIVAFLTRTFGGTRHVLVRARAEAGFCGGVELGPTVQYSPGNYDRADRPPPLFADVVAAGSARVLYEAVHGEEGGRFLHALSRYLIVEVGSADLPREPPPEYRWLTPGQLSSLVAAGRNVTIQARTLLACLNAMAGHAS